VLELAPGQGGALAVLYQIRKATGPLSAAQALVRRLVALQPNNVWATQELALLLFGKGDFAEAEVQARNAVRIAPTDAQSHNLMGMILTEANRPQVGEYHYRRALELLAHRPAILLANLAWNLKNQGKMAEARAHYAESLSLDPTILQTLLGWARMEETDRDFTRADALLDQAERLAPGNPSILLHRAVIRGRTKDYDEALAVANDTTFGLTSGICTTSLKYASHFKRNSEAGMVMVNLPTAGVDYHVAFGGRKGASYGSREQGRYAAEFFTTVKTAYTLP